jgi:RNA polymerase sigma-70 factor, ECF subfamily
VNGTLSKREGRDFAAKLENTGMDSSVTIGFRRLAISANHAGARRIEASLCPDESEVPDEVLIARVQVYDNDAMSQLFRRYSGSVHAVGLRILRDNGEAEDLVQEVFLYLCRRSRLFDVSKGSARSWIFQVAYTQALIRRRQLKSHGFYASAITDRPTESGLSCGKGAHFDNTVEGCFGKDGWKSVWDALTECQRETLRLHFYEGCTFAEIAERLSQSYVNIRHHYYRGLEKLREHADDNNLNWP